jgi:hypothetical protein
MKLVLLHATPSTHKTLHIHRLQGSTPKALSIFNHLPQSKERTAVSTFLVSNSTLTASLTVAPRPRPPLFFRPQDQFSPTPLEAPGSFVKRTTPILRKSRSCLLGDLRLFAWIFPPAPFGSADPVACSLDLLDLRCLIAFCDILLPFTALSMYICLLSLVPPAVSIPTQATDLLRHHGKLPMARTITAS